MRSLAHKCLWCFNLRVVCLVEIRHSSRNFDTDCLGTAGTTWVFPCIDVISRVRILELRPCLCNDYPHNPISLNLRSTRVSFSRMDFLLLITQTLYYQSNINHTKPFSNALSGFYLLGPLAFKYHSHPPYFNQTDKLYPLPTIYSTFMNPKTTEPPPLMSLQPSPLVQGALSPRDP